MKILSLSFYFSILSSCYGADLNQDLILGDKNTITLSGGIQLHEVSPDILAETNKEMSEIASQLSDLKETFQYIQETITLQEPFLKDAEGHVHETDKNLQEIVDDLEKLLTELPEPPIAEEDKPQLVFRSEIEAEHISTASTPTPKNQSTLLNRENGIATTIATAGGLTAFGISQFFAAPLTLTVVAVVGTTTLGFGGTKLHFNKDSLPSLKLPSLSSFKPNLNFLPSWPFSKENKDDVYRPQLIKSKNEPGARVTNLPSQLPSQTVYTEMSSDM